jgi:hypothetical protein
MRAEDSTSRRHCPQAWPQCRRSPPPRRAAPHTPPLPSGPQASFTAKVSRRHRLDAAGAYPEEMGVAYRYPGRGRVAEANFSDPKWVDGELLEFSASANPLVTGGARLGFVWSVPDERRFLIMLNRVALE